MSDLEPTTSTVFPKTTPEVRRLLDLLFKLWDEHKRNCAGVTSSRLRTAPAQVPTQSRQPLDSANDHITGQTSRSSESTLKRKRTELADNLERRFPSAPCILSNDVLLASQDSSQALKSDVSSRQAPSTELWCHAAKCHSKSSSPRTPIAGFEASNNLQFGGRSCVPSEPVFNRFGSAPYIFISSTTVLPSDHTARLLQKRFETYGRPEVRIDQSGYLVVFQDDEDGLRNLKLCYESSSPAFALEKHPLNMHCYPQGRSETTVNVARRSAGKRKGLFDQIKQISINNVSPNLSPMQPPASNGMSHEPTGWNRLASNGMSKSSLGSYLLSGRVSQTEQDDRVSIDSTRAPSELSSTTSSTRYRKTCHICSKSSALDVENLAVCSKCSRGFHRGCHKSSIPSIVRNWKCYFCECGMKHRKACNDRDPASVNVTKTNPRASAAVARLSIGSTSGLRPSKRIKIMESNSPEPVHSKSNNSSTNSHAVSEPRRKEEEAKTLTMTTTSVCDSQLKRSREIPESPDDQQDAHEFDFPPAQGDVIKVNLPRSRSSQKTSPTTTSSPTQYDYKSDSDLDWWIYMALVSAPDHQLRVSDLVALIEQHDPSRALNKTLWRLRIMEKLRRHLSDETPLIAVHHGKDDHSKQHLWVRVKPGCKERFAMATIESLYDQILPVLGPVSAATAKQLVRCETHSVQSSEHDAEDRFTNIYEVASTLQSDPVKDVIDTKTAKEESVKSRADQADSLQPIRKSQYADKGTQSKSAATSQTTSFASFGYAYSVLHAIEPSPSRVIANTSKMSVLHSVTPEDPLPTSSVQEISDLCEVDSVALDTENGTMKDTREQRMLNFIREQNELKSTLTTLSLRECRPQTSSIKPSLAAIRNRPSRKQLFGKPAHMSRLGPSMFENRMHRALQDLQRETTPQRQESTSADEERIARRFRTTEDGLPEVEEFDSLETLLGMPSRIVPGIYEGQLVFKEAPKSATGRSARAKNFYRIGKDAKAIH